MRPGHRWPGVLAVLAPVLTCGACTAGSPPAAPAPAPDTTFFCEAVDLHAATGLDAVMPGLNGKRVVFVGEDHGRYDHHLAQLEIIRRLHASHPRMVIGMEAFQQSAQGALDDYVSGRIDEHAMLRATHYYDHWHLDYRLYQPILRYARASGIPILGLNIPRPISARVGRMGLRSLSEDERKWIPAEIDRSNSRYRERLREEHRRHWLEATDRFDDFVDAQLLWDESMAACAAGYLSRHPERIMVVLAGSGHLVYGDGIPSRLLRRAPVASAIVLNGEPREISPGMADILLITPRLALPPAGGLGARLGEENGVVRVRRLDRDGAAARAGMARGDRIVAIDGEPVSRMRDLSIALLNKAPGDTVRVTLSRRAWAFAPERAREVRVTLR